VTSVPRHNGGHTRVRSAASVGASVWYLTRLAAVFAVVFTFFVLLAGVWTHAVADLFDVGWDWWGGR